MAEPTINIPFAIGETVWHAGAKYREEFPVCPDCNGDTVLTLKLGNGEVHTLGCGLCSVGYQAPTGYVRRQLCLYEPTQLKLARVTGFSDGGVDYTDAPEGVDCYHIYNSKTLFTDVQECARACEKLRQEAQEAADKRDLEIRKDRRRALAFNVSYWRREAAKLRKELATVEKYLNAASK